MAGESATGRGGGERRTGASAPQGAAEEGIEVRLDRGAAFLPGPGLWLDPARASPFAFVSHAHADHVAPHGRAICSEETRRLVEARFRKAGTEFVSLAFGESFALDPGHRVELLPAGHIPGSAMLFVERLGDGAALLHTGDFKTRPSLAAEPYRARRADTLIMETTFGLPRYRLPPAGEVREAMAAFARATLEEGAVPVFLAYSLGKAQEVLLGLHRHAPELRCQAHPAVLTMNEALAGLGLRLPPCESFAPGERSPEGCVVIVPPSARRGPGLRALGDRARLAMVSGWALDAGAKYRYRCDEVFPLSDHADYDDLLAFVEEVSPRRVLTVHGFREEFAKDLRDRGRDAWPLQEVVQLELPFPPRSLLSGARTAGPSPPTETTG